MACAAVWNPAIVDPVPALKPTSSIIDGKHAVPTVLHTTNKA